MSPTVLLADPSVRLAGVRPRRRLVRVARRRARVRWKWLLAGVVLMAAALTLAFLQTWPPLATVMSGSMAPTIDTGDVVVLKRLERPARVGDVVSIPVPDEARSRFGYPPVVIHRVVGIDAAGIVSTKGDARKEPDPFTVPATALTTRVVATVPAAGRALAFLGSPLGLLWLVGGATLLIGMPLVERYRDAQRRVADDRDGLQTALESVTAELIALRADRADDLDFADEQARRAAEGQRRADEARALAAEAQQLAAAERARLAAEAAEAQQLAAAERARLAAEAAEAQQLAAAERARLAAEAAEARLVADVERERLADEAREAQAQLRAVSVAFARHLDELPALIERAIADAFASTAPPPPVPVAEPTAPIPAPRATTPDLLGCLVPASRFEAKPSPTPDLFGALKPKPRPKTAWDAPPPDLPSRRRFAPPVNTFFA